MDEQQWLSSTDLMPMIEHLGDRFNERKIRLFACAAARQSWKLLDDEQSKVAIEVAERFADGLASVADLRLAFQAADTIWSSIPDHAGSRRAMRRSAKAREAAKRAAWLARNAANPDLHTGYLRHYAWRSAKTRFSATSILRELFGPLPFRAIAIDPTWLATNGSAVCGLADTIDEDGTFDLLPVLGDALEDAGCADAAILDHLRGDNFHSRGCWVLDLIRGKQESPRVTR